MAMTATEPRRRTRRCAWTRGAKCREVAKRLVHTAYLGVPADRPVPFCEPHFEQIETLITDGWTVTKVEDLNHDG